MSLGNRVVCMVAAVMAAAALATRACSAGRFAPFNNATAGYEDNVVSWPSVEPADDYAAASLFAFALGGTGLG
jgi:hypothetical protein